MLGTGSINVQWVVLGNAAVRERILKQDELLEQNSLGNVRLHPSEVERIKDELRFLRREFPDA